MDNEYIKKIAAAWQEVVSEKKKLDPVDPDELKGTHAQRKDKDIDNDGDVDKSDEYLHNRRKTVKHAMKKEGWGKKKGSSVRENGDEDDDAPQNKNGMKKCPHCDGSTENHDEECPKYNKSEVKKATSEDIDAKEVGKALKHDCASHVTSEQWGYGECIPGQHTLVEQEDGTAIVTHYDVMFEHGIEFDVPVSELTVMKSESHMHSKKKVKEDEDPCWDSHKMVGMKKKNGKQVPNCVPKEEVEHEEEVIAEATVAEVSDDVEKTYIEKMAEQVRRISSIWEKASQGPAGKPSETMLDKFKGGGAKQMAADNHVGNPKAADMTPEEQGHEDATKAGRVTKQSPVRPGDNKNGDTRIVNPVAGAVTSTTGRE